MENINFPTHRPALLLILLLLCPALVFSGTHGPPAPGDGESIRVPGGTFALSAYFDLPGAPARTTILELNRRLLATIRMDHDWRRIGKRAELVRYLESVAALEQEEGASVTFDGTDRKSRRDFARLAGRLGYDVSVSSGGPALTPRDGDADYRRRRLARALGWNLKDAARRLGQGETVRLTIATERISPPLDLDTWSRMTGRRVDPGSALLELARDQRFGLVLEGLSRVSAETASRLEARHLEWIYRRAPFVFYRYGASLEVRQGRLVVPGGIAAEPAWESLLGVSPAQTDRFIRAVLDDRRGAAAYLWNTFHFAPARTAEAVTAERIRGPGGAQWRLEAIHRCLLEDPQKQMLTRPVCRQSGLISVVYAPRLDGPLSGALEGTKVDQRTLERSLRMVGILSASSAPPSPESVALLEHAASEYPMALAVLDRLDIVNPELLRQYLATVAHLAGLAADSRSEMLVGSFQGGVELLRLLHQTGALDAADAADHLDHWVAIHLRAVDPRRVVPDQLEWLNGLLAALTRVSGPGAPGRGPAEQALLAALTRGRNASGFVWEGLDCRSESGVRLAERMARLLDAQAIPGADQLLDLHATFTELAAACRRKDAEAAGQAAGVLIEALDRLPAPRPEAVPSGTGEAGLFASADRKAAMRRLKRIRRIHRAERLRDAADRVREIEGLLAGEIRPLLLAPVYLEAIESSGRLLEADHRLVRKHALVSRRDRSDPLDNPWRPARIVPPSLSDGGLYVAGGLAGVTAALAAHGGGSAVAGLGGNSVHPCWVERSARTPWWEISPAVSAFVSAAVETGRRLIELAEDELAAGETGRAGGPALERVRATIPAARLERAALQMSGPAAVDVGLGPISHSECFQLGMSMLRPETVEGLESPELRAAVSALQAAKSELGDGWRAAAALAGAPTPLFNGTGRSSAGPWPPYEALDRQGSAEMMAERLFIDVRLAVICFLGRHRLPGPVGADLERRAIERPPPRLPKSFRDWEPLLAWIQGMDEQFFRRAMRDGFTDGDYIALL